MLSPPFLTQPIKQNLGRWEMDGKIKNERVGVLRRQETLPFCFQTENQDRWEREGRKNGRLKVQKSLTSGISPSIRVRLERQSIHLFIFQHPLVVWGIHQSFILLQSSSSSVPLLLSSLYLLFSPPLTVYTILHPSILTRRSEEGSDGWIKKQSTTPLRLHSSPTQGYVLTLHWTQRLKSAGCIQKLMYKVLFYCSSVLNISWCITLLAWCQ